MKMIGQFHVFYPKGKSLAETGGCVDTTVGQNMMVKRRFYP
jgi:hypothetical protein